MATSQERATDLIDDDLAATADIRNEDRAQICVGKSRNSALRTCAFVTRVRSPSKRSTRPTRCSVQRAAWCTAVLSSQMAVARVTTEVLVGAHQVTVYGCVTRRGSGSTEPRCCRAARCAR